MGIWHLIIYYTSRMYIFLKNNSCKTVEHFYLYLHSRKSNLDNKPPLCAEIHGEFVDNKNSLQKKWPNGCYGSSQDKDYMCRAHRIYTSCTSATGPVRSSKLHLYSTYYGTITNPKDKTNWNETTWDTYWFCSLLPTQFCSYTWKISVDML